MSSNERAANATTSAVQSGLYGVERANQGASGAIQTSRAYKDQTAETYDGLTSSGKDKLESVQKQVSQAANHLQAQASAKVDDAVAQGQHDVEETKATTATYLDQAKALAGTALGSAQDVLHRGAAIVAPADPSAPGIVSTLQATTSNALEATGGYLGSAQAALTSKVPQGEKQDALDNAKFSTTDITTAATTSTQSAAHEPSQAAQTTSNTKAAIQPHVDAAKQTASTLINSATQTAASITPKSASTQTQGTQAPVNGNATASTNAARAYTSKPQNVDSAQPLVNHAKGPMTPVGFPAEGIEGVLTYGEDKADSVKHAEQGGEQPKDKAY